MADQEGGTRINRSGPPQQQGPPDNMMSQQRPPQQQMDPQEAAYYQQQAQQQAYQQAQQQAQQQPRPAKGILKQSSNFGKSAFGGYDAATFKNALLVTLIFVLLNSKMIWKQIIQFPMMGTVDPSIIALIVNSIIAGMVFYLISNFIMKN